MPTNISEVEKYTKFVLDSISMQHLYQHRENVVRLQTLENLFCTRVFDQPITLQNGKTNLFQILSAQQGDFVKRFPVEHSV